MFSVLHIEDSEVARAAVAQVLRETVPEATITWVASEAAAIDFLDCAHWDLVIVDLQLEDGQGFNCLTHCRRKRPAPRAIVLSDFAVREVADRCREAGAQAVLRKTELPRLRALLHEQLRLRAIETQPAGHATRPPELRC